MLKYYLSQIDTISKKISLSLSKTDCIFLYGELGSGKTTFVRSLVHQLQKKNRIKKTEVVSPTFSLLHEYEIKNLKVMHYDLYRVITIIEWPEIIKKTIANRLEITFYHQKEQESRKLKIKGYGKWKKFKLNAI